MRLVAFLSVFAVSGVALADGDIEIGSGATTAVNVGGVFTCPASSCELNAGDVAASLAQGDVLVQSSVDGSITVVAGISWATANRLTLWAQGDLNVQATIVGSSGASALTLRADGQCRSAGKINADASTLSANTIVALQHDATDLSPAVASGALAQSQLVDSVAELQLIGPAGNYAIGCDIVDPGTGYTPIGSDATPFTGTLDGLGHAIVNLTISSTGGGLGMFGALGANSSVQNLVLIRPSVSAGADKAGALAASATSQASISNVAALSVTVSGTTNVGGLVGYAQASNIDSVYVTGRVSGTTTVGGVLGDNDYKPGLPLCIGATPGTLSNAASKASVTGTDVVGGLVGSNEACSCLVSTSWSAGAIAGGGSNVGGAIGNNSGATSAVHYDTTTSGIAGGSTTAQMHAQATFGSFNFTTIWAIREGYSRPFLRSMQTLLDVSMSETSSGAALATQPVTFTVTIGPGAANYAQPQGIITFFDGTAGGTTAPTLGTASIGATAPKLVTSQLTAGTHTVVAYFPGDDFFIENIGTVSEVISKAGSATALAIEGGPIVARVTAVLPATGIPTGSVDFTVDGSATPVTIALVNGVAVLDPSTLTPGLHTVSAAYPGDAAFDASSAPQIQVDVSGPTSTTLNVSTATSDYGDPVGLTAVVTNVNDTPTGSALFIADGNTTLGEIPLTSGSAILTVSTLSAGTHSLTVQYKPDDVTQFTASVSAPVSHVVNQATSATQLSVVNIIDGVLTLSVNVMPVPSTLGVPTGSVVFVIDDNDLATIDLLNGVATFASSALARGNHTVAARYSGDVNYLASQAAPQTIDVEPTGFRFTATPTRAQVLVGGAAPITLSLAPEATDFSEEVSFDCQDLPTDAFCTFTPTSTTIAARGTQVGLVITTQTPIAGGPIVRALQLPPPGLIAAFLVFAGAVTLMTRRRRFALALVVCAAFACKSDGNGGKKDDPRDGTPPGTYTITINAHSVHYNRSATVQLSVQ